MNKRWATETEIKSLFSVKNTNLARLARQNRVARRLGLRTIHTGYGNGQVQATIWEYYVPQVREWIKGRRGQGQYVSIRTAPRK